MKDIIKAIQKQEKRFFSFSNVVAVSVGYKRVGGQRTDERALVFHVERKLPISALESDDIIPKRFEGFNTDIIQTGEYRIPPIAEAVDRTGRFRPMPFGVSLGHFAITAGTAGFPVHKGGELYILTNNHVAANSNDAAIGDMILQPGPYDGGNISTNRIGELADFVPISFGDDTPPTPCPVGQGFETILNWLLGLLGRQTRVRAYAAQENLVDAAIVKPDDTEDIITKILKDENKYITPAGITEASLGMIICKAGRTTGYTESTVQGIGATVDVNYGDGKVARFKNQVIAGAMSQGGDSGSGVMEKASSKAVGLLFAGSDNTTVMNRIQDVCDGLKVSI